MMNKLKFAPWIFCRVMKSKEIEFRFATKQAKVSAIDSVPPFGDVSAAVGTSGTSSGRLLPNPTVEQLR